MKEVIVISGFGRCGSSLTMQMLKATGLEVLGRPPGYELQECNPSTFNAKWIAQQYGKVLKVLIPRECGLIKSKYKFIWVHRDHFECAKSIAKFQYYLNPTIKEVTGKDIMRMYEKNIKEEPEQLNYLTNLGSVCIIRFEDLIMIPNTVAENIAEYLEMDLDIKKMVSVVLFRDIKCQNDLNIEIKLMQETN